MKITAGLGCIDHYERLVKAGVDEVFCGFVPYEWNKTYGTLFPLNRREVLYYNVQIGSYEDMKILKKMVDKYKVPVTITFNYLYYLVEQYKVIEDIMKKLMDIGFREFIIADLALLVYLKERGIRCSIHLSGECAEINSLSMKFLNQFDISRYIFHRKNTIEDMNSCIEKNSSLEYEAFILNERCHYTGAFCSSLHCDELMHLCKVPYEVGKLNKDCDNFKEVDERLSKEKMESIEINEDGLYKFGSTGCGICALKKLKEAGITHLKVVGRGNYIDVIEKDIINLKKIINNMEVIQKEEEFKEKIKGEIFKEECSHECYY